MQRLICLVFRLSKFLLNYWVSLWSCAHLERVELKNNEVEPQPRDIVIYLKISFCIQSVIGRRFVKLIISVIATCKLHKIKPLEHLKTSIESFGIKLPAPILIPDEGNLFYLYTRWYSG
jgi:hypothetical protein